MKTTKQPREALITLELSPLEQKALHQFFGRIANKEFWERADIYRVEDQRATQNLIWDLYKVMEP